MFFLIWLSVYYIFKFPQTPNSIHSSYTSAAYVILHKAILSFMEKEMATHSSILAWEILETEGVWWAIVNGVKKSQTRPSN